MGRVAFNLKFQQVPGHPAWLQAKEPLFTSTTGPRRHPINFIFTGKNSTLLRGYSTFKMLPGDGFEAGTVTDIPEVIFNWNHYDCRFSSTSAIRLRYSLFLKLTITHSKNTLLNTAMTSKTMASLTFPLDRLINAPIKDNTRVKAYNTVIIWGVINLLNPTIKSFLK